MYGIFSFCFRHKPLQTGSILVFPRPSQAILSYTLLSHPFHMAHPLVPRDLLADSLNVQRVRAEQCRNRFTAAEKKMIEH
jgi:hypothetical protein